MFKKIVFFLSITLVGIVSKGQELYFNSLTVNEGLTQHDVSCVLKDSYGFTWIGTYDGLNRYDGFSVLNFYRKSYDSGSLSSNRVLCLFEDSKKRIWIGTDGGGLNYYSLVTEKFERIKTPKNFDKITAITENSKGEIFFATTGGLLKVSKEEGASVDILQLPVTGLRITGITTLQEDDIIFSTNQGVWTLKNNKCEQIQGTENVYSSKIIVDRKGLIWVILNGKLSVIKENVNKYAISDIFTVPGAILVSMCEAKDGTIWIGTENSGLYCLDPRDQSIIKNVRYNSEFSRGLLSNSIISLYCDKDNILWVGNRQGLCYTNLSQKGFKHVLFDGLPRVNPRPHIRTLFVGSEYLYYGVQNRGLFRYSLSAQKSEEVIKEDYIYPLCINKIDDTVYAGTNKGVFMLSGNDRYFTPIDIVPRPDNMNPTQVLSICGDETQGKYFGTFSGLIITKGNNSDWIHNLYPQTEILKGKRIFSLLYDKDESCVWVGTLGNGLFKLNLTKDGIFLSLEQFSQSMNGSYHIADNNIWCFYKDKDGYLWIGTDAGLLRKAKGNNQISQLNIEDIVDKKIMGIVGDDDSTLWLTNSKGLIRFNTSGNVVRRYSYNDGLQSSTFTEAVGKGADGTLYFGSIHGIDFFNPRELVVNPYKPAIAISDFRVHNISISPEISYFGRQVLEKSINLTDKITLNYKQNNFSFEFTGTNYDNTTESHFRYKLEGYDSGWIYKTGAYRFANYSNLEPGRYIFWADAANSDGIWSETPKKILITILPAPWFSWWAYLAYFIVGASIIFGFLFLRRNRQKLRHEIELKNLQYDKEKAINEVKLMFFTDVAHEFKTPLSLIVGPFNDIINNDITEEHRKFCFNIISRNTKRMMLLVSQLLDFSKLNANKNILKVSNSDLSEFVTQISQAFQWLAKDEQVTFNVIAAEKFECYFDRDLIEKVVYNLLSNAFKNTPAYGIVEVEVMRIGSNQRQLANICVRDSGKGIPDEQKGKIFERYFHGDQKSSSGIGLHLSGSLISAHKGKLTVSDSVYGGSEFIVSIPVSKDDYNDFEFSDGWDNYLEEQHFHAVSEGGTLDLSEELDRILVVEDDHDLRAYLKNCLKTNYLVIEAQNGIEGLKKANENLPDIIITDVMMPEMNGIDMCKALKADSNTSHIPVLMLTAKTAQEQEKQGLDAGAFDYISKPFNIQALIKKIDNIVKARRSFRDSILKMNLSIDLKKNYTPFDEKLLTNAIKVIENNMGDERFSVEEFARQVGFSRMQLHRKLKALAGCSATEFINAIKINYAKKMFDSGCDRVNEAMDAVGITSYSHFNKLFKKINGITPSDYLRKNE